MTAADADRPVAGGVDSSQDVPASSVPKRASFPPGLRNPAVLATLLTALSGFLDAAAFVELNRLYVSFMSGNSTHLGMVLAAVKLTEAIEIVAIIGAFVAGAGLGTWIAECFPGRLPASVLGVEGAVSIIAFALALGGKNHLALMFVATAMGLQNALHQIIAGADVGKTFITGALFGIGQSLARALRSDGKMRPAMSYMLSWSAFVAGAAVGAATFTSLGLTFCLAAALILILVLLVAVLFGWL